MKLWETRGMLLTVTITIITIFVMEKQIQSRTKYETVPIWKLHHDEKHEIVKVLICLQDHSNNNEIAKF